MTRRGLLGLVAAVPSVVFGIKAAKAQTKFDVRSLVGPYQFLDSRHDSGYDLYDVVASNFKTIANAEVVVAYVDGKPYILKNRYGNGTSYLYLRTKDSLPRKPDSVMVYYRYPTPGWKRLQLGTNV